MRNSAPEERARRLFFAVWPPPEAAAALRQLAESLAMRGSRLMPARNLHVTLAFLGRTREARLADAVAAARGVSSSAFALEIDRLGYWSRSRILWAGPRVAPAGLTELAAALRRALEHADFELDDRKLAAHVTLARKARRPGKLPEVPRTRWDVREFALVESTPSDDGSRYATLERFALHTPTP